MQLWNGLCTFPKVKFIPRAKSLCFRYQCNNFEKNESIKIEAYVVSEREDLPAVRYIIYLCNSNCALEMASRNVLLLHFLGLVYLNDTDQMSHTVLLFLPETSGSSTRFFFHYLQICFLDLYIFWIYIYNFWIYPKNILFNFDRKHWSHISQRLQCALLSHGP